MVKEARLFPEATSQIWILPLSLPAAILLPSLENTTAPISPPGRNINRRSCRDTFETLFHRSTPRSVLVANNSPSGEKAALVANTLMPGKALPSSCPEAVSHHSTRFHHFMTVFPSGENATGLL